MATKLRELTEEQTDDFTQLAKSLSIIEQNNKIVHNIGAKYNDFIAEHWNDLEQGVKIGDLWLKLKLTVKLLASQMS